MEAIHGCTKTVTFQAPVTCQTCGMSYRLSILFSITRLRLAIMLSSIPCLLLSAAGSGVPPGTKPETCKRCKGAGEVSFGKSLLFNFYQFIFSNLSFCVF